MKKNYTPFPQAVSNYLQPPKSNIRHLGSFKNCFVQRLQLLAAVLFTLSATQTFAQNGFTCETAIDLDAQTSPYSSTTVGAGNDYTPSCVNADNTYAPDMYFYIQVPNGYTLRIAQTEETYDAIHAAFYGNCNRNTEAWCLDDPDSLEDDEGEDGRLVWENNTGADQRIYWIQDGYADYEGEFTLEWSLAPPPACNVPMNIDVNLVLPNIADIAWGIPNTGTATGYEYAVTLSPTPPVTGTPTTATALTAVQVTLNVTNYVHVRSNCGAEGYSEWETYAFYSGLCYPGSEYINGEGITNVTLGSINNTTELEDRNYGNYSALIANVGRGVTQQFSITLNTESEVYEVRIWVDWNNNLVFDEGEEVYNGMSRATSTSTLYGTFTVPATAELGNHRLRVGAIVNWNAPVTPCSTEEDYAVFEDYTINVTTPPLCFTPLSPEVVNVSPGIINVSWTAPTLGGTPASYEYALTAATTPPASGTTVTATSVTGLAVTSNVAGFLYVRTNCGGGNYSDWVRAPYYNGLCLPSAQYVDGDGITNVTIGSINNTTEREPDNYGNFSDMVVNAGRGVTQQFSISLFTYSNLYDTRIWVDWNDNITFDAGEEVFSTISPERDRATITGTFLVPLTAPLGNHRLRIGSIPEWIEPEIDPCYNGNYGTFEDYTINVTPAPSCYSPTNTAAVNIAPGIVNLSWTAPVYGGTPTAYEYAITTTPAAPATGTVVNATTVAGAAATMNVNSYLHVRTNCGGGDYSAWVTIPFYNGVCIPQSEYLDGDGIINVTIGSINNTTEQEEGNYGNYGDQIVNIGQSVTQPFSITLNVGTTFDTKIWVDWNNDLDFEDEGEEMFSTVSPDRETATISGTITIPATATLGNHRMRIGAVTEWNGPATPCYDDDYGTYEDYTINVTTPPSCFMPVAPQVENTAGGIATISWTAPTLGTTPAGYQYAVNTTTTPPQSGTAVTATQVTNINVTQNVTGYLHVRTNCGGGDYSEWITIPFYNGVCIPDPRYVDGDGITNVTMGSINNTATDPDEHYTNNSSQVINVGQGVTQRFRISFNTYTAYDTRIWVDWNDDLDFTDAGEEIYTGVSANGEFAILSGTFTVPVTAALGNHRLRIGAVPEYNEDATPCFTGDDNYGDYEDYTINVTIPPTCYSPNDPAGVTFGPANANLTWTAPTLGGAPIGYEYAVTTGTASPASGTPVTNAFVNGYTAMEDNVYYYLHVRTNCGDGDYSEWVISDPFRYLQGDTCATAIDLGTQTSPYTSSTTGADNNYTPPCGESTAPEMFYSIEVPNGYTLTIGLTDMAYDALQSIFYGDSCNEEEQTYIECTDDDSAETVWENLTGSSQTVYFVQDGWGSNSGEFTIQWELTPPASCDRPRNPSAEVTSLTTADVSWVVPNTGIPVGYQYAVTTSSTPPESGTYTTALSAANITLTPNVFSYLHVRTICSTADGNSIWVTYEFFSGYCVPVTTESEDNYITGITTTDGELNINNTGTGFSSVSDYTAQSVTTYAGGSFVIHATTSTDDEYLYSVFIDWNNNFDFTDAGERVISSGRLASPATLNAITLPLTTPLGSYRMRIRTALNESPVPACGEIGEGEAEDYTLIVGPTPTCFPPFGPSIAPLDETTVNLSWGTPFLGGVPQGYEYVLSSSPDAPTGSGTPTTALFLEGVPYNPADNAYLFVRSFCGGSDYSAWATTAILGTNNPEVAGNNVKVYKEGSTINITSGNTLMTGVTIYDIRGSKLYTQSNINATDASITGLQIQQQVVIVEVITAKGKVSKRIVF